MLLSLSFLSIDHLVGIKALWNHDLWQWIFSTWMMLRRPHWPPMGQQRGHRWSGHFGVLEGVLVFQWVLKRIHWRQCSGIHQLQSSLQHCRSGRQQWQWCNPLKPFYMHHWVALTIYAESWCISGRLFFNL